MKIKDVVEISGNKYELDGSGEKFLQPVEKRVKKSKFAALLIDMTDEEIKALGYCLLVSHRVKTAIEFMSKTVEKGVQFYALEKEYEKRVKNNE